MENPPPWASPTGPHRRCRPRLTFQARALSSSELWVKLWASMFFIWTSMEICGNSENLEPKKKWHVRFWPKPQWWAFRIWVGLRWNMHKSQGCSAFQTIDHQHDPMGGCPKLNLWLFQYANSPIWSDLGDLQVPYENEHLRFTLVETVETSRPGVDFILRTSSHVWVEGRTNPSSGVFVHLSFDPQPWIPYMAAHNNVPNWEN